MKNYFILFFVLFSCSCGVCMEQDSVEKMFKPSVLGQVYSDLSKAHLTGKWLSSSETKKADHIIKDYDLSNWNSEIKSFELDMLFQVGIILESLGYRELAADMILFAHTNGYDDNFVMESLQGKMVNKKAIIEVLKNLKLNS